MILTNAVYNGMFVRYRGFGFKQDDYKRNSSKNEIKW